MGFNDRDHFSTPDWVELICELPLRYRQPGAGSIRDLFAPADSRLNDRAIFISAVGQWIHGHRYIADAWRTYSGDKRSSPGPYFGRPSAPLVVGFYDGSYADETTYTAEVDACADFIFREASWVLRRHRVEENETPPSTEGAEG